MSTDKNRSGRAFPEHVRATLLEDSMIVGDERVLVAVSGGPDSVCLLHVLLELGISVEAAHFDHQTRDGESAEDARFVRATAEKLGIAFHTETRPVLAESLESALSFEQHARDARYDFLLRTARTRRCAAIATGHHADDMAETILMRILRGTTTSGIAGIPSARLEDGIRIIRPLIRSTREDVLAYLDAGGHSYRVDRTNADTCHVRNRVRHELLPRLAREYNPKIREALVRLGEAARRDSDFVNEAAEQALERCWTPGDGIDREVFATLHPAIQGRLLLMLAWRNGVDCPFARVVEAMRFIAEGATGSRCDLGGGLSIANGRSHACITCELPPVETDVVPLAVPGESEAFGRTFRVSFLEPPWQRNWAAYCSPFRQVFDADALGASVAVRHRRAGDRFAPHGMIGSKKLQDYFVDRGVPLWQRDAQLIVLGDEHIAWIVGHGISGHVAITKQTRKIVEIEVLDATEQQAAHQC